MTLGGVPRDTSFLFLVYFLYSLFLLLDSIFSLFDVIVILAVCWFVLFGFWFGLVQTLGSLFGIIVAALTAGRLYTLAPPGISQFGAFVGSFLVIQRLVGFLFYFVNKTFHLLTIIPFLKTINRLAGAAFGIVEGVVVVGTVLLVASRFDLGQWFTTGLTNSPIAPKLVGAASIILPLLP